MQFTLNTVQCCTMLMTFLSLSPSLPAYGVGFVAVLIVSLLSLLGVVIIPLLRKKILRFIFSFLVAMGVAALVCDAVLHLIPHVSLSKRVYVCTLVSVRDTENLTFSSDYCVDFQRIFMRCSAPAVVRVENWQISCR